MSAKVKDRIGALLLLSFVVILWAQRDYITPFGGIFPDRVMIITASLLVLDLILSFTPYASLKEENKEPEVSPMIHPFRMAVMVVSLLLWAGLIRYLGFALTSIVAFTGISYYLSKERKKLKTILMSALVAFILTSLIVVVFEKLLLVPLPEGEWIERLL